MSNHLKPFEPFADLMSFDPVRSIEDMFRDFGRPALLRQDAPAIRVDVDESDHAYTVSAEIPGVRKEDIKVQVDGNLVSISAERKQEKDEKKGNTVRSERYWGQQSRSFTLQCPVDDAKADARYEHGVLTLTLPKKAGAPGHRLAIR